MYPPPPASDDSAVESMSSGPPSNIEPSSNNTATQYPINCNATNSNNTNNCVNKQKQLDDHQQTYQNASTNHKTTNCNGNREPITNHNFIHCKPKITRPSARDLKVCSEELRMAILQMHRNNSCLLSRSTRTVLTCFDDLEVQRFGDSANYLINFISNGINTNPSTLSRPVSILWPDGYEQLVEQVAILDAYLLNVNFKEKPVAWMLENNLTTVPLCRNCKEKMNLQYENNTVRWRCLRTLTCSHYFMPVQRPSFFKSYEKVSLDKLLFSIYYWSTCTPTSELYSLMKIEPTILDGLWRRLQNVCRNMLEKKYPRLRLTDSISDPNTLMEAQSNHQLVDNNSQPVDLISIKLNELYIVCGKHPRSNLVRLGLLIPGVSTFTFVTLTESWFAHGTNIRIAERKFLDLTRERSDLKLNLVSRTEMISKDGRFDRNSAFGYIICQLSHVLKDFNSSSLSCENLRLILAEMEWREIYGTTPYDAFCNIVAHISELGESADWYSEPSMLTDTEEEVHSDLQKLESRDYLWVEQFYYANVDPVDKDGKVICRFAEPPDQHSMSNPVVTIKCHECNQRFESFDFSFHMISHVELNRHENEREEYRKRRLVECKHCFKNFPKEQLLMHKTLLRSHLHLIKYGCRICCVLFKTRTKYLEHMRLLHFEHETPYHCPSCKFASSFQRDVYIHFQEEHRQSMIILCPICLRSFTVKYPEKMTDHTMAELSKIVYNHIGEHYVISKCLTCSNCSLCFLSQEQLFEHASLHHNPKEIRPPDVRLDEFLVTKEEEEHCVKAKPVELYETILTPTGGKARCCECFQLVIKDHFVDLIDCKNCKYTTQCPDAAIIHNKTMHMSAH